MLLELLVDVRMPGGDMLLGFVRDVTPGLVVDVGEELLSDTWSPTAVSEML